MTKQGRVAILSGNGLTIDYSLVFPVSLSQWNSRTPFRWRTEAPGDAGTSLLDGVPLLKEVLSAPVFQDCKNDFDKFDLLSRIISGELPRPNPDERGTPAREYRLQALEWQTRLYLVLAYSQLQFRLDWLDYRRWRWVDFLQSLRGRLVCAVSFNYDLVLERALSAAGLHPAMAQCTGSANLIGVPLIKPHGSIDFDTTVIRWQHGFPVSENWSTVRINADILVRRPAEAWLSGRNQVEIVLPNEHSYMSEHQWVRRGFAVAEAFLPAVDHCLIAGLSYWIHDRSEIDHLLSTLHPRAEVIIVDPYPSSALIATLEATNKPYRLWTSGPQAL